RNRYNACKELGLEPPLREYTGDSPLALVWSRNRVRRHLTWEQKLQIANAMLPLIQQEAAMRMKRGAALDKDTLPARAGEDQGEAMDIAGRHVGVSGDSVGRYATVQAQGTDVLKSAFKEGEVSLRDAAAIAKLDQSKQAAALAAIKTKKKLAIKTKRTNNRKNASRPTQDKLGREVPKHLQDTFGDKSLADAAGIVKDIVGMAKSLHNPWIRLADVVDAGQKLAQALLDGVPWAVHKKCGGKG